MKQPSIRPPHKSSAASDVMARRLGEKLVGQPAAIQAIVPFVQMHQAGLEPEGRPVGIFLLLGPTGTGKTRTVEALAEVIHGSPRKMLRVDCGEFQMEHEVAKLIGAPPGYLGHRETQPLFTQQKLASVISESSDLSIVLFDEIEKAAQSLTRLLLGVLDKAALRLGDNNTVNFEKSMIFMTSNLGARNMHKELHPDFGFEAVLAQEGSSRGSKLEKVALMAARKQFSPEFMNRIDSVVTYQPLSAEALACILDQQIVELQRHLDKRLGIRSFRLDVPLRARKFLLKKGTSDEYGARELKRTLHRNVAQPLAAMVSGGQIRPGSMIRVELSDSRDTLLMRTVDDMLRPPA